MTVPSLTTLSDRSAEAHQGGGCAMHDPCKPNPCGPVAPVAPCLPVVMPPLVCMPKISIDWGCHLPQPC